MNRAVVNRVIWGPDGKLFGVAYSKQLVHIFSYFGGADVHHPLVIDAHVGSVNDICFMNTNIFLSCGDDRLIKVWDAVAGTKLHTFEGHEAPVYSVCPCFKDNCEFFLSSSSDGVLKHWDYRHKALIADANAPGHSSTTMAYNGDGTRLFLSGTYEDGEAYLLEYDFNLKGMRRRYACSWSHQPFGQFDTTKNRFLAGGGDRSMVNVWNMDQTAPMTAIGPEGLTAYCCKFNKNGSLLAVSTDNLILIYGTAEGEKLLDCIRFPSSAIRRLQKELSLKNSRMTELKKALEKMEVERKLLTNRILELQGNIRVFCRVRPLLPSDGDASIEFLKKRVLFGESIILQEKGKMPISNKFDKVFLEDSGQEEVFTEMADMVQGALDGFKVSLFSYGQTGSGKTYSMVGKEGEKRGMIPRAIEKIFDHGEKMKSLGWTYKFKVCMIEIYREKVYDLLKEARMSKVGDKREPLDIVNFGLPESVFEYIGSKEEFHEYLNMAKERRSSCSTQMNEESSRSHFIITLSLHGQKGTTKVQGVLNMVDLAGTERASKTGSTDSQQQKEAIDKNNSLGDLRKVFRSMVQKEFNSYRGSKLTMLLKPYLSSARSKMLMMVNVSPALSSISATMEALRVAEWVNKCTPAPNPNTTSPRKTPSPAPKDKHQPKTAVKPPMYYSQKKPSSQMRFRLDGQGR